jgi:hypothetical protein
MIGFWVGAGIGLAVGLSSGWLAGVATAWWVWMKLPQSAGQANGAPARTVRAAFGGSIIQEWTPEGHYPEAHHAIQARTRTKPNTAEHRPKTIRPT